MTERPTHLLIVEHDILLRHPLAEYLRGCGFEVLEAASESEALDLLASHATIELVLIDLHASSGAGFTLAQRIRADWPQTDVLLSGTPASAIETARTVCHRQGTATQRGYDHELLLNEIRRTVAARRNAATRRPAVGDAGG